MTRCNNIGHHHSTHSLRDLVRTDPCLQNVVTPGSAVKAGPRPCGVLGSRCPLKLWDCEVVVECIALQSTVKELPPPPPPPGGGHTHDCTQLGPHPHHWSGSRHWLTLALHVVLNHPGPTQQHHRQQVMKERQTCKCISRTKGVQNINKSGSGPVTAGVVRYPLHYIALQLRRAEDSLHTNSDCSQQHWADYAGPQTLLRGMHVHLNYQLHSNQKHLIQSTFPVDVVHLDC